MLGEGVVISCMAGRKRFHEDNGTKMSWLESIEVEDPSLQRNRSIKYPRISLRRCCELVYKLNKIPSSFFIKLLERTSGKINMDE